MSDSTTQAEHATLAEALLAAQIEMPAVDKDGTNPHFKSKFTTLGNLLSKVRPVLNRHGLALVQAPSLSEGQFVLRTTIMHSSGQELTFDAPLAPTKNDPQGQGSAITYMRRYSLASALAIADQDDDDGSEVARNDNSGKAASDQPVGPGIAGQLVDRAFALPDGKDNLQLAASTAAGRDVGDCSTKKKAVEGLAGLTFAQAEKLSDRIGRKEAEVGQDADAEDADAK